MKLAVIYFSGAGESLAEKLAEGLSLDDHQVQISGKSRYAKHSIEESLGQWTERQFSEKDGLIFIGACGIAVRAIAPFIVSKKTDPAVMVVDDMGRFAISLLSGHLGGANELTETVSKIIGAIPVVTTATDNRKRFAPDVLAKKNGCIIDDIHEAKVMASAIVHGEKVAMISRFPLGKLPDEVDSIDEDAIMPNRVYGERGLIISPFYRDKDTFAKPLWLIPRALTLGIGCKRGTCETAIAEAVAEALDRIGADRRSVACVASIDLKAGERGLVEFCGSQGWPFVTYTARQLEEVKGEFHPSAFVKEITGVDNVCERSAWLAAFLLDTGLEDSMDDLRQMPVLIGNKFCKNGVTVAVGMKKWRIRFE